MRNLKRVLSLALALVMVLGMMVISTSAATFAEEEIENVEAVEVMNALGIVKGDGGKFYPERVLTREEAAKIMAYVTLGPDVEKYLTGDSAEGPFFDVKADRWSAKYITYCKNLGIIDGMGDGNFNPKGELTVVGFGKLLLGAIGYDTTAYTGSNWVNAVKDDMVDAKLDIVEFDAKTTIDRDTACQMALIAMKAELVDAEEKWVVKKDGDTKVIKSFTDMLEAYTYASALTAADGVNTYTASLETVDGTLLEKVYEVTPSEGNDDQGRPANIYTKTGWTAPMVFATEAVKTYTEAVTSAELYEDLGLTKATKATWYIDGRTDAVGMALYLVEEDLTEAAATEAEIKVDGVNYEFDESEFVIGGDGYIVEVHVKDNAYTVVQNAYYLAEVKDVTEYEAATATTEEVKASSSILVYGFAYEENRYATIATDEYEVGDMLVVICKDANGDLEIDKIVSYAAAEALEDVAIESYTKTDVPAVATLTVGGKEYKKAAKYAADVDADTAILADDKLEGTYNLYLDPNGNLLGTKEYTPAAGQPTVPNYAYVADFDAVQENLDGTLLGNASTVGAAAAQVIYMDGTSEVLNFKVLTATNATKVTAASDNGVYNDEGIDAGDKYVSIAGLKYNLTETSHVEAIQALSADFFTYAIDEDGYLSINSDLSETVAQVAYDGGKLTTVADFSVDAKVATVGGISGAYANANTVLVTVNAQGVATTYTGYANFPEADTELDSASAIVYTTKGTAITGILVIGDEIEESELGSVTSSGPVAVYIGTGNYTADGQWYKFWVDGEVKSYLLEGEAGTVLSGVAAKDVVTLTLTDGKISATAEETTNISKEVALVEEDYVVFTADGVQYFDSDVKVFNISKAANAQWAADELEADDTVTYLTKTTSVGGSSVTTVIYVFITTEAPQA